MAQLVSLSTLFTRCCLFGVQPGSRKLLQWKVPAEQSRCKDFSPHDYDTLQQSATCGSDQANISGARGRPARRKSRLCETTSPQTDSKCIVHRLRTAMVSGKNNMSLNQALKNSAVSDFVPLQQLWADLSAELWEGIFCCLESSNDSQSWGHWIEVKEASYQACCCRYALVYKKFRIVLLLHRRLCLRTSVKIWSLLSLLDWIKKHASVDDSLMDISPEASVAVLYALYISRCQLKRVALTVASISVIPIAAFSSISACILLTTISSTVSLQPLRALPSLDTLRIGAVVFTDVADAAAHLIELRFDNCLADCGTGCACVTSLVRLQLHNATVKGFHREGLAACSCLKVLHLSYARFAQCGHVPDVDFASTELDSSALSKLSALTDLRVGPCGLSDQGVSPWLDGSA